MTRPGRVQGKVVIVTGAARGIGRACAALFAREGARLVLNDVDGAALAGTVAALGEEAEVVSVVGDVSADADARRIVAAATDAFGTLDTLVANAGIIPLSGIEQASAEEWDRVMAIDGRGMFLTCKYAVEAMGAAGGSIVCLSSISGLAGQTDQAAYGPAKFVASGLTKHLAVELAPRGIRVNAVAPGTIRTEAVAALPEDYVEPMRAAHPMGRLGEPEEVAEAICFLASDAASFITGAILPVDGGYLAR